jgi:tyrosine-protein kinase Etk/Wzc
MSTTRRLGYAPPDARLVPAPAPAPEPIGDEIDLRALLGVIADHRRLIIAITALFFCCGLAYVLLARPVYRATALLQVEQAPTLPGINAVEQAVGASNPAAIDALSIVKAYSVVQHAVEALHLNVVVSPYRIPLLGALAARLHSGSGVAPPWPGLAGYGWGGTQLDITHLTVPGDLLGAPLTLLVGQHGEYSLWQDSGIPFVSGRLLLHGEVGQVAKGSGVTLDVATLAANPGMRFHVVRNHEARTIAGLQASISAKPTAQGSNVIALGLDSNNPKLAVQVLDDVTQAFLAQNVGRNSAQATNSLKFVRKQMPVVKERLVAAQAALNAYQLKAHSVSVPLQTQSLLTELDDINSNLRQLDGQRIEAARLYTPEHPAYRAIMSQIGMLNAQKAKLEKSMDQLPDTQRELLRLNGNVEVLNTTYNGLLNEAQQLEIAQAGAVGTTRIVDEPTVNVTRPVKPRKLMTVAGATFAGGVIALALVFLRQFLKRGMEDPAEIEQLGLPVFTAIPLSKQQLELSHRGGIGLFRRRRQPLLALAAPEDLAAEALRTLRTSLYFTAPDAANNRVMICGASPNAGKTFVSANLAAINAQAGQRVLLIDANMRDGELHTLLGGRPENGLSELLADRIVLEEAVRSADGVENLDFIPSGRRPSNPSELLMQPRLATLLWTLSTRYDLIVIDTPPILAVTDATIIGHHVDTSLLVVRFGMNQSREVELALHRFRQSGVDIRGVVFNGTEQRNGGAIPYPYDSYGTAA